MNCMFKTLNDSTLEYKILVNIVVIIGVHIFCEEEVLNNISSHKNTSLNTNGCP